MDGFSQDGYIVDQDFFSPYVYRGMTSNINGCGWIAAYNLRRALGQDMSFEDVHREMNAMFPLQIPGPTPMGTLRRYLRRYIHFRYVPGKKAALAAGSKAEAGILRYWEGAEPHFICFVKAEGEGFRFLNVSDGQEDITLPMADFFAGHCHRGFIRVLAADRT